jgi:hypothetical protein
MIEQRFADGAPMNDADIADEIEIPYGKTLAMDTLRHIIRRIPGLKAIRGRSMEKDRVFCDTDEIDDFYRQLAASLESATHLECITLMSLAFSRGQMPMTMSFLHHGAIQRMRWLQLWKGTRSGRVILSGSRQMGLS